jgi:hypothetical protein
VSLAVVDGVVSILNAAHSETCNWFVKSKTADRNILMDNRKPATMLTADELRQVMQTAVMNGTILAGIFVVVMIFVLALGIGLSGVLK